AEITQSSSLVVREDKEATLTCSQNNGHGSMYWYVQQPEKGMQLLYHSFGEKHEQEGDVHVGYKAKRLNLRDFHLYILSVKKNHSAVYLCASSVDTALQSHLLSLHELHPFPAPSLKKGAALSTGKEHVG
ncbi:T-cell receptor beta chain V region LB2, partial [Tauraco erythrolophus]